MGAGGSRAARSCVSREREEGRLAGGEGGYDRWAWPGKMKKKKRKRKSNRI
jgi:hypothetical protein